MIENRFDISLNDILGCFFGRVTVLTGIACDQNISLAVDFFDTVTKTLCL